MANEVWGVACRESRFGGARCGIGVAVGYGCDLSVYLARLVKCGTINRVTGSGKIL